MPVVEYFEKSGKVVRLQCDQPPDKVYESVKQALKVSNIERALNIYVSFFFFFLANFVGCRPEI